MDIQNKKILFLCTGNSCRSQIAEGLAKKHLNNFDIESAGTNPETINPAAIKVMEEIDINLSNQFAKSISEDKIKTFDIAITLCGDAKDKCLNLNRLVKNHFHWDIKDPAKVQSDNYDEKLDIFRKTRTQILNKILTLKKQLDR